MEEEMKLIASATAALGLVLAATPALAELPEKRTATFGTGDIDLSTQQGQKEINWRIDRAVRHVCQIGASNPNARLLSKDAQDCVAKARSSAQQQVARLMSAESEKGG
jgi:UrcA family protein